MEAKAKYFPKTAAALQSLQETAAELKQAAEHSAAQNKNQADKLSVIKSPTKPRVLTSLSLLSARR